MRSTQQSKIAGITCLTTRASTTRQFACQRLRALPAAARLSKVLRRFRRLQARQVKWPCDSHNSRCARYVFKNAPDAAAACHCCSRVLIALRPLLAWRALLTCTAVTSGGRTEVAAGGRWAGHGTNLMEHYIKDPSPQMTRMQAGQPVDAGFSEPPRLALLPSLDLVATILPKFVKRWREMKQLTSLEQVRPPRHPFFRAT